MGKSSNDSREAWYKKLKAEGFEDIETRDEKGGMDGPLKTDKRWNADKRLSFEDVAAGYESEAEYYRLAGIYLHECRWRCDTCAVTRRCDTCDDDRRIWELHADGVPYREIADRLGLENHMRVHYSVNESRDRMKERYGAAGKPGNSGKPPFRNNGASLRMALGDEQAGSGPDATLQDILGIVREQVGVLRSKAVDNAAGKTLLGIEETRALCEYARVLLAVSKDRRAADDEDLSSLPREELMKRLEKHLSGGGKAGK